MTDKFEQDIEEVQNLSDFPDYIDANRPQVGEVLIVRTDIDPLALNDVLIRRSMIAIELQRPETPRVLAFANRCDHDAIMDGIDPALNHRVVGGPSIN